MWIFKSNHKNSYLAANPKVLTQTLRYQPSITRLKGKKQYLHFLLKSASAHLGPEYIMLVKNPYKRVESFFKEKLRQKVRQALNPDNPYILKRHQFIFYPYLNITPSDSISAQVEALLKLDFKDFVRAIPKVYHLEDHLAPQTDNFSLRRMGITLSMKMNRYVRVEDKSDLQWVAHYFNLDLSQRRNSTADVDEKITWDEESMAIIQQVFKNDFEKFGYNPTLSS